MNAVVIAAAVPVGRFNLTATVVGLVVYLAFVVGISISLRLLMGDRYRKSTPRERWWDMVSSFSSRYGRGSVSISANHIWTERAQ
jgi:hypothetical protein